MASTTDLDAVIGHALARGASVRLIGDDEQLASISAGGVIKDIAERHHTPTLSTVVRFNDPSESAASLAIRAGDPTGIAFYIDNGRVHVGADQTAQDMATRPGLPTSPPAAIRSCWHPPMTWSPRSTNAPAWTASPAPKAPPPRPPSPSATGSPPRSATGSPPAKTRAGCGSLAVADGSKTATGGSSAPSAPTDRSPSHRCAAAARTRPCAYPPTTSPPTPPSATPAPSTAPKALPQEHPAAKAAATSSAPIG